MHGGIHCLHDLTHWATTTVIGFDVEAHRIAEVYWYLIDVSLVHGLNTLLKRPKREGIGNNESVAGQTVVTIEAGDQGLYSHGCGTWTKIN